MSALFHIDFHPGVESDYSDAYHWYELQQKGLGDNFMLNVREKLDFITQSPEIYSTKSKRNYREAIVKDFPYLIVYRIYTKERRIFVSAIHHQKDESP